jgi:hypothetical protein
MERKYKILGFNDDQTSCDVCGHPELRGTYAMEDTETGVLFRAGSTCGAKMAGWSIKQLKQIFKAAEKEKADKAKQEFKDTEQYKAHEKALQQLELIEPKQTPIKRLQYLQPTADALHNKAIELSTKYNLPTYYFH